jgi:hypothetical protein
MTEECLGGEEMSHQYLRYPMPKSVGIKRREWSDEESECGVGLTGGLPAGDAYP